MVGEATLFRYKSSDGVRHCVGGNVKGKSNRGTDLVYREKNRGELKLE